MTSINPRLLRMAVVLTRGDEALAEEIVQAALLTAAAKLKPVAGAEHLWNWLARVTRQQWSKAWRRQQREPCFVNLTEAPEPAVAAAAEAVLEQHLDTALQALHADERQMLEWFYFDGLSHKIIAARLSTSPKAVASRLERTRAKLRSILTRRLAHET